MRSLERTAPSAQLAAPKDWPSVSVLVPAWEEAAMIDACLDALDSVEYPDWELIVVAGGHDDTYGRVAGRAAAPPLTLLAQTPEGKNAALTRGLAVARGDVIVVLDADSQVAPDWLYHLVAPLLAGAHASSGDYRPLHHSWISRIEEMDKIAAYQLAGACVLQGSGSIAVWRDVLGAVGGFPSDVRVGVDWDLDRRLARAGLRRRFAPEALVLTSRPATLGAYWRNEVRWRRAHLRLTLAEVRADGPGRLFADGRYYLIAWGVGGGCLASTALTLVGRLRMSRAAAALTLFVWLLAVARRCQTPLRVARHTGDASWQELVPGVALLLTLSFAATWHATLTVARHSAHFKGPR